MMLSDNISMQNVKDMKAHCHRCVSNHSACSYCLTNATLHLHLRSEINSLKLLSVQAPVLRVRGVLWLVHNRGTPIRSSELTAHRVAVAIELPDLHARIKW
jgi:hypothetical protein